MSPFVVAGKVLWRFGPQLGLRGGLKHRATFNPDACGSGLTTGGGMLGCEGWGCARRGGAAVLD